jgi:hypothetical protein
MPDRIIRTGILTSDSVNKLGAPAEVFYRRLMSVVDDHGRYDGRAAILRAVLYPLQLTRVSEPDIGKWILETGEAGLVRRYTAEGRPFLEIVKFGQKIRSRSKWPDPPTSADNCQQVPTDVPVCVVDMRSRISRASRLPEDWALPEDWRTWTKAEKAAWPDAWIERTAAAFKDYWLAAPKGSKLDWQATWRNWVRNAHDPKGVVAPSAKPWAGAK